MNGRLSERRQLLAGDKEFDGASLAGASLDRAAIGERDDHLVGGRRRDPEVGLEVGFRRCAAVERPVGVDEGQILPLEVRETCDHGLRLETSGDLLRAGCTMHVRYRVALDESERRQLEALVTGGTQGVRRVKRAPTLLVAAAGASDETIAGTVQVGTSTVYRTKRRLVEEGLAAALA